MKSILVKFEGSPVNYLLEHNDEINVSKGQLLLVETSKGLELVRVISPVSKVKIEKVAKKDESFEEAINNLEEEKILFVRIATARDIELNKENKELANNIKLETKKLAKKYGLEMKISGVKIMLDKSKAIIYFTAENRVDFRELVKELAGTFKTRIELRQIGARDETRILGGIGPCGQKCCCKRFLNDFGHVSIKMAKNQNISLNPTKINGICGRLLCCLEYENDYYAETLNLMPKINSIVSTPLGNGVVLYNDILKRTSQIKIGDENNFEIKTFKLSEIKNKG